MTQTAQQNDRSLVNDLQGGSMKSPAHTTPVLRLRKEFRQALSNYHMNPRAQRVLNNTPYVVLNGPTSTGRNTVIRELLKTDHYYYMTSDTTRPPRYNDGVLEKDGEEYFFRSEEDMLQDVQNGEYLEAELIHNQQVSGQSIREFEKANRLGKIALNEIEILGILAVKQQKPDTIAILLLPPSFDEWLARIQGRTAVNQVELNRRLRTAIKIFTVALEQDVFTFVVNKDLARAVRIIDEIARGELTQQNRPKDIALIKELLQQTTDYLAAHKLSDDESGSLDA